jgi:hypothetical protein
MRCLSRHADRQPRRVEVVVATHNEGVHLPVPPEISLRITTQERVSLLNGTKALSLVRMHYLFADRLMVRPTWL